jgi:hypothetical protein
MNDVSGPTGLLLIRGLGHSGSTILDLALGAHPSILGLGEAVRVLDKPLPDELRQDPRDLRSDLRFKLPCTCGDSAGDCSVWGSILSWLQEHDDRPLIEKFNRLIDPLLSASTRWIVESFQSDQQLIHAVDLGIPVRVVYLVRDVRSWSHNEARRGVTRYGRGITVGWRSLLRWWRVNRRTEKLLRDCGHPVFHLGYEELALQPEAALRKLCDWLDIAFDPAMLQPGLHSRSHIVLGNQMIVEPIKSRAIRYDAAWLNSSAFSLRLAMLLPAVKAMNCRLVYSNDLLGSTWPAA